MIDLHLHLDGSLGVEETQILSEISGVDLPYKDINELKRALSVDPDCTSLVEYLEKFELPLRVLQTAEAIEQSVYLLLKRLSRQGLCYVEIRFAPQLHVHQGLNQKQVVQAAIDGLQRGTADFDIKAQLILCCMRMADNHADNLETVAIAEYFLGKGVCAIDLAGAEAAFPVDLYEDIFALAKEKKIPYTIHAGEAAGAESVKRAIELGAWRIGHGVRSVGDEEVIALANEKQIAYETCFVSNLQTKAVASAQEYPLKRLFQKNVRVTINTDNMTVSDTTLKNEYRLLQKQFGFSTEDLKKIALNAADVAFVEKDIREGLHNIVEERFEEWMQNDSE